MRVGGRISSVSPDFFLQLDPCKKSYSRRKLETLDIHLSLYFSTLLQSNLHTATNFRPDLAHILKEF